MPRGARPKPKSCFCGQPVHVFSGTGRYHGQRTTAYVCEAHIPEWDAYVLKHGGGHPKGIPEGDYGAPVTLAPRDRSYEGFSDWPYLVYRKPRKRTWRSQW